MKVMFDTNADSSFIRDRSHAGELQLRGTVKYISAVTLMELWAGARIKKAERLILPYFLCLPTLFEKLQFM
jgi:predicted nucleic acid-binding protein